jgi:hypothetical protein
MMRITIPDAAGFRELLRAALPASTDADTLEPQLRTLFTPDGHRTALDPDVTIVRGARGVGKTIWFKALHVEELRVLAAEDYQLPRLRSITPVTGYGTQLDPEAYPGPSALDRMLDSGTDPYHIWVAVVLRALGTPELTQADSWAARTGWVRDHPEAQEAALAMADRQAGSDSTTVLVLFDALDRLHSSRDLANRLIEGILRLALELRTRTRNLRAKVFIRPDMYDAHRLHFPDASKLSANAADLRWTTTNLYGLFFQQLGNADSEDATTFREATGSWREAEPGRYTMPWELQGDRDVQWEWFDRIAGPWMGANHRKGYTYTWLPNHLVDGIGQTSPRSFIQALRTANDETIANFATHEYALHWDGIRRGVQEASLTRVREVGEDLPWVSTAMEPLSDLQVPIDHEDIVARWDEVDLSRKLEDASNVTDDSGVRTGPRDVRDYDALIEELIEIGIITRRATGRLDLPDVYRLAFGLGRKGGIPRLAS